MTRGKRITLEQFRSDRHGKTFGDVLNDPEIPFDLVVGFFSDARRQQRMEDAEIHHDRAPLAGVIREFEAEPTIAKCFETLDRRRGARLRQAIGVLVRMVMERRGWTTTGRKGSLGVPSSSDSSSPEHNKGGLSLWFVRAERYRREEGMPFRSVRDLCKELEAPEWAGVGARETGSRSTVVRKPAATSNQRRLELRAFQQHTSGGS